VLDYPRDLLNALNLALKPRPRNKGQDTLPKSEHKVHPRDEAGA